MRRNLYAAGPASRRAQREKMVFHSKRVCLLAWRQYAIESSKFVLVSSQQQNNKTTKQQNNKTTKQVPISIRMSDRSPSTQEGLLVVDLFCGAGGFSAGVHMSGGTVLVAVDSDPNMLALHHHNFPRTKHVLMKLGQAPVADFGQALLATVNGRPWHLHGSPPCQSFSIAYRRDGHQTGDDERTNLTFWYLELVQWLRTQPNAPCSWSMEQVPTALKRIRQEFPILDKTKGDEFEPKINHAE